jgi:quinol monooxygenase YgiN
MIIEIADLAIKDEYIEQFRARFPAFREILLSVPGGIAARCLQDQAAPEKFCFLMQWESKEAKDLFMNDPRLQAWAKDFGNMTTSHVDRYFDEIN